MNEHIRLNAQKKRERRCAKQTTARNKQTIINITYETVHFIMCPVGCSHRSVSGTADYQTIASLSRPDQAGRAAHR